MKRFSMKKKSLEAKRVSPDGRWFQPPKFCDILLYCLHLSIYLLFIGGVEKLKYLLTNKCADK
jgi:hypothetical protein